MTNSQVSLVKCRGYNSTLVEKAVKKAVDRLGGIEKFVKKGERVLIKPNILSGRRPEEAVCTHPEVVRAVIRLVKNAGGRVSVGDSPGGFLKNIQEVYEISGIGKVARDEKVNLVKFAFSRTIGGFPISIRVLDTDKVISIPKFKTHEITGLTAAVKNMYGAVVGLHKTKCHADAPTEKKLAKVISTVYSIVKPDLNIVDAIVSMEGEGPSAGEPRKTDFIMAGSDGVAIDAVLSAIVGTKPLEYAVNVECRAKGLGETDLAKIDLTGSRISKFKIKNFKHAKGRVFIKALPDFVTNFIASNLKFYPEINNAYCKKCNMCKSSCPVKAISIIRSKHVINRGKCIRCMCCREVCPYKAIDVKKSWLAKLLWE